MPLVPADSSPSISAVLNPSSTCIVKIARCCVSLIVHRQRETSSSVKATNGGSEESPSSSPSLCTAAPNSHMVVQGLSIFAVLRDFRFPAKTEAREKVAENAGKNRGERGLHSSLGQRSSTGHLAVPSSSPDSRVRRCRAAFRDDACGGLSIATPLVLVGGSVLRGQSTFQLWPNQ